MWPSLVVMPDIGAEHTLKMSPSSDEHPVQALRPNRPHPSFGEGVRVRSPDRGGDDPHPFCSEHLVERPGELGVTVADQELNIPETTFDGEVAGPLGHPGRVRVGGRPGHGAGDKRRERPDAGPDQSVQRPDRHAGADPEQGTDGLAPVGPGGGLRTVAGIGLHETHPLLEPLRHRNTPPPAAASPPTKGPRPARRGRPKGSVSLTEEKARLIITYIRAGAFADAAAQAAGVAPRTFREGMARGEGSHPP